MYQLKKFLYLVLIVLPFLVSCINTDKSQKLTVTTIHKEIIKDKTTVKDLKNTFGDAKNYFHSKKSQEIYEYWNGYEGGVNYMLENNTDYWETVKTEKTSEKYSYKDFEGCYEYGGENLGIKSVYFFIIDGKVHSFKFNGSITNKSIAKKDKYLRQIID